MVIDTVHSPGFFTRPPFGSIEGYVYDSTGVPLPNSEIMLTGFTVYLKGISIWTDQNGYFRDTALYAKNYSVIVNGLWLPFEESITIEPGGNLYKEFSVPLKRDVVVEGTCTLADDENPAGTMVIFDNRCPGIAPDTVYTDDAGYFIYPAKTGSYYLWYSHAGYFPHPYYITLDLTHSLVIENQTLTGGISHEIPSGSVSGVWENDHPYWILGDITLEEGDTLTIQSGVNLNFIDECAFNIYGTLIAEGNAENIITIQQYSFYSYNGFQFLGENSSASRLQYISFSTETSLSFFNSSPAIDHALLFQTGFSSVGIYHSSAPLITNSSTSDTRFTIGDSASPVFRNNFFSGAVFTCRGHASPQFEYNDFYQSYLRAVECYDYTKPRFTGNIFFIGETGIYVYDEYGIDSVKYNSFFGLYSPGYNLGFPGICELDTININSDSCDYYFNITKHPRLVDPENGDFHLLENSPCIDAGDPASPMDPDSTIADIGAIYFYQLNGRKVRSYPLSINNSQGADLQIYDLDLHSGTYIYRFELKDEEISSGKIIIINP